MVPVMFNRIHTLRKPPKDEQELRQIFLDEGIDAAKFDAAYNALPWILWCAVSINSSKIAA